MAPCIFCEIVAGTRTCHLVWHDVDHLAFLTIFPNTPGFTVVIPRVHHPSYAFDLPDDVLVALTRAARSVGKRLDRAFPDVGRTAMIFEGFGVDHIHAKLVPLHGTRSGTWQPILSDVHPFSERYAGFITSHDGPRAPDEDLAQLAERIRNA